MDSANALRQWCLANHCPLLSQEDMSRHTTMRVGGPAEFFAEPDSIPQLQGLLGEARRLGLPVSVVGNGSNLLVSDAGVKGLVICLGSRFSTLQTDPDGCITALAGTSINRVCQAALRASLTGLEFAWGIPASVGGAVYMNAGAYGGEIKDVLESVQLLAPDGTLEEWPAGRLEMAYRHTALMETGYLVLSARFRLTAGEQSAIQARMDELIGRRREKQPLEYPSSGSTFKRPQGAYAAQLIDQCGLKGMRVGGAMISEKHAGFLINYDRATCADILQLIAQAQAIVQEKTGYRLECEVKRLGIF